MGILRIVFRNFAHSARTRRPTDRPPFPKQFRGALKHDATLCTGCEVCSYVCSPGAISFGGHDEKTTSWKYFSGQCSFCGLCAQYCPMNAINLEAKEPPVTQKPSDQHEEHKVTYKTCPRCGKPVRPLAEKVLNRIYHGELPANAIKEQLLCAECRRKAMVEKIRDSFLGKDQEGESKGSER
jgi:hydrogenase-4 component H